jgi:hypothetical protein
VAGSAEGGDDQAEGGHEVMKDRVPDRVKQEILMAGMKAAIEHGLIPREMTEADGMRYLRAIDEIQMAAARVAREAIEGIARSN